jgi:hypothetical protein
MSNFKCILVQVERELGSNAMSLSTTPKSKSSSKAVRRGARKQVLASCTRIREVDMSLIFMQLAILNHCAAFARHYLVPEHETAIYFSEGIHS